MRDILIVIDQIREVTPKEHKLLDYLSSIEEAIEEVGRNDIQLHWNKLTAHVEEVTGKIPMGLLPPKNPLTGEVLQPYHPYEQAFRDNLSEWQKQALNILLDTERF